MFAVNNGVIRDLSIVGATVSFNFDTTSNNSIRNTYAGILSGSNTNSIYNVYTSGTINYSSINTINSNNSDNTENAYIGGLTGVNSNAIVDTHSNVSISTHSEMTTNSNGVKQRINVHNGGLVGLNSSGYVLSSYAQGNLTSTSYVSRRGQGNSPLNNVFINIGGLIGTNQSSASNSFASGSITSSITVQNDAVNSTNAIRYGGLIGQGSSVNSYRSSLQSFSIASGPTLTLNNTGTLTNDSNLRTSSWVFNASNLNWDDQIWEVDGSNYPRLINNNY